jgi:hypothetical protein
MELQMFFNMAVGLAGFFGGWVLNSITRSLDRLDRDIRSLQKDYVTKTDYHRDIDEIKSICKQIFDKLDAKADKS